MKEELNINVVKPYPVSIPPLRLHSSKVAPKKHIPDKDRILVHTTISHPVSAPEPTNPYVFLFAIAIFLFLTISALSCLCRPPACFSSPPALHHFLSVGFHPSGQNARRFR